MTGGISEQDIDIWKFEYDNDDFYMYFDSAVIYASLLALGMSLLTGTFAIFPAEENGSTAKQLQLMTGVRSYISIIVLRASVGKERQNFCRCGRSGIRWRI